MFYRRLCPGWALSIINDWDQTASPCQQVTSRAGAGVKPDLLLSRLYGTCVEVVAKVNPFCLVVLTHVNRCWFEMNLENVWMYFNDLGRRHLEVFTQHWHNYRIMCIFLNDALCILENMLMRIQTTQPIKLCLFCIRQARPSWWPSKSCFEIQVKNTKLQQNSISQRTSTYVAYWLVWYYSEPE